MHLNAIIESQHVLFHGEPVELSNNGSWSYFFDPLSTGKIQQLESSTVRWSTAPDMKNSLLKTNALRLLKWGCQNNV